MLGADSVADRLRSPAAVTVEPLIAATVVFVTRLPMTVKFAEEPAETDTPMVTVRMIAEDSAARLSVEPVVSVVPVMSALVVFAIAFPAMAMPALAPPPATPKPSASTIDRSFAERVTAPAASTSERLVPTPVRLTAMPDSALAFDVASLIFPGVS